MTFGNNKITELVLNAVLALQSSIHTSFRICVVFGAGFDRCAVNIHVCRSAELALIVTVYTRFSEFIGFAFLGVRSVIGLGIVAASVRENKRSVFRRNRNSSRRRRFAVDTVSRYKIRRISAVFLSIALILDSRRRTLYTLNSFYNCRNFIFSGCNVIGSPLDSESVRLSDTFLETAVVVNLTRLVICYQRIVGQAVEHTFLIMSGNSLDIIGFRTVFEIYDILTVFVNDSEINRENLIYIFLITYPAGESLV